MITLWPARGRPRPRTIPSGPTGYPWLGVLPQMQRDSLGFLTAMARTYGDIVGLPLGPHLVYLLCHPAHIAYVLQGNPHSYGKSRLSHPGSHHGVAEPLPHPSTSGLLAGPRAV
jgi:hypothetical protein